jgi:flagellar protein FliS
MFGSQLSGANAYSKVGMETGVVAATPHKLIIMLFEGALLSISSAIQHMQAGNMEAKGKSISRAVAIISEGLRASLDKKVGGEIALSLDALYEYMIARLMMANLKNQPNTLEEIYQLLKGLKDAWEAIDPNKAAAQPQPAEMPAPRPYDPLAPHTSRLVKA